MNDDERDERLRDLRIDLTDPDAQLTECDTRALHRLLDEFDEIKAELSLRRGQLELLRDAGVLDRTTRFEWEQE